MKCYLNMVRFHSIFLNFLKTDKSKPDNTSHLELPNTENVSFNKGKAKLFLRYSYIQMSKICYYSFIFCNLSTN